ncbi:MAG: hypothetical protein FWF92_05115 [Oscillospiraceae bacterium]|nr:hypothetical protein [Oscillospiraceae bacterium]
MKRIIALFLIISTLAVIILSIASCGGGGLSGTYSTSEYGIEMSYKFSGNKITVTTFGISMSGTYKIDGDNIIIKTSLLGISSEDSYSFEQISDKVIAIDGIEYTKK